METENRAELVKAEMCVHMKELVEICREKKVFFGGCGDCGSPWLECEICDKIVDNASYVFDSFLGGNK